MEEKDVFIVGITKGNEIHENFIKTVLEGVKSDKIQGILENKISIGSCCSDRCYFWGISIDQSFKPKKGDILLFYIARRETQATLREDGEVYLGIVCATFEVSEDNSNKLTFWKEGKKYRFLIFLKQKPQKLKYTIIELNNKLGYSSKYFPSFSPIAKGKKKAREFVISLAKCEFIATLDKELNRKKQVILYGPPGTGKTYVARKYVTTVTNESKPGNFWNFITFHQSYSYEEFIEGFRPKKDKSGNITYEVEDGIFKKLAIWAIWSAIDSFAGIWEKFKDRYPKGSKVETKRGNEFEITEYTEEGIKVKPKDSKGEHDYSLLLGKFKKLFENRDLSKKNIESIGIDDINSIIGDSGSSSYYLAIYTKLREVYEDCNYDFIKKKVLDYLRTGKPIDFSTAPRFYLIIDEINRGNISKILGELITLLEKDKRLGGENQLITTLPYSGEPFAIPPNLYIIGTMNTTDRSIALLDIALRRRFSFIEVPPSYEKLEKVKFKIERKEGSIDLAKLLKAINERIAVVKDIDHKIGHSYFLGVKDIHNLYYIWYSEILPLLTEYFYNDWETIKWILNEQGIDSGNVFFRKVSIMGPNEEEAYQLERLGVASFIEAIERVIGKKR